MVTKMVTKMDSGGGGGGGGGVRLPLLVTCINSVAKAIGLHLTVTFVEVTSQYDSIRML